MKIPSLVVIVAIFLFSTPTGSSAHAQCVGQEATVIALVALHEGPNCSLVSLRGIQQEAAILAAAMAVDSALNKDGMNFRVRVFDTCADPREAVSATLRSLAALPHACLQPPLLLGFVGPQDDTSLEAVQKVTGIFSLNHALPFHLDSTIFTASNKQRPLYVTSISPEEQLQYVEQLVAKLEWSRVTLLYTAESATSKLASSLTRRLCVQKAPLLLPEYGASVQNYSSIMAGENNTPVVILAGSTLPVSQWLRLTQQYAPAYLVVASSAGLLTELINLAVPAPVVVLQYTAGRQHFHSNLWDHYSHQHLLPANADIQSVFADIQDSTVTPMAHSVRLYGSALSVVRQARCQGRPGACSMLSVISPDQWRNVLSVAMAPVNSSDPASKRIRFRMEMPAKAEIFLKMSPSDKIIQVGHIDAGKLDISEEFFLVPSVTAEDVNSTTLSCWSGAAATLLPTINKVAEPEENKENDKAISDTDFTSDNFAFYEMIGYLTGISVGIFLVFLIGLFIVTRIFIPKKQKSSPPSSVCSVRTRD